MITFKALNSEGDLINSALSPFTFPAGEAHTKNEERRPDREATEIAIIQSDPESLHTDLFQYAMWADFISRSMEAYALDATKLHLVLPYIPGARADRGAPLGAAVYTDFLRRVGWDRLVVFDPHSEVSVRMLGEIGPLNFPLQAANLVVLRPADILTPPQFGKQYAGIIAPDAGATGRAGAVAVKFGLPLYTATKSRDPYTGKLTFGRLDALPEEGNFLLVDDICDGGGTFRALAQDSGLPKERLDLYVSHGVFSGKALEEMPKYFNQIYTTNSYAPSRVLPSGFIRLDVIRQMVKAINV